MHGIIPIIHTDLSLSVSLLCIDVSHRPFIRSLDSPSTSAEALSDAHHMASNLTALQDDSDVEVEPELPPLEASIPKEILKKLRKSEKKRQDVINGMIRTFLGYTINVVQSEREDCFVVL